ncbi:MAG: SGNH/GDSL hydrolase family protein [Fimbriiglobus sp.]
MKSRRAVQSLLTFLLAMAGFYASTLLLVEFGPPRLVDPEYGRRLEKLKAKQREHPDSPWILGLGSSRMAMGLHPGSLVQSHSDPKLFNFALVGSGPIMQRLAWHRLQADGIRPAGILIEYWPPFLHEVGAYHEAARFDPHRVRRCDETVIQDHFPNCSALAHVTWEPWRVQRRNWLNQVFPRWLPNRDRRDAMWSTIDPWGRLPSREKLSPEELPATQTIHASYYQPLFSQFEISPDADDALQKLIAEARAAGVPVAMIYLPESRTFTEWMPEAAQKLAAAHEAKVRAWGVPFVDARYWIADAEIPDRIHLLTPGAKEFTARLNLELPTLFPTLTAREWARR